jgi:hypothetical protein
MSCAQATFTNKVTMGSSMMADERMRKEPLVAVAPGKTVKLT